MRSRICSALMPITMVMLLGSGTALAASNACKADLNADGVVNFGDLAIVKSVFFQRCPTPPRFEDRGATVFDPQTNLEWEKKIGVVGAASDGSVHDVNQFHTWSTGTNNPDGTAFAVFLAGLNGGATLGMSADGKTSSGACYADHCDWRLPTIAELNTIVDCSKGAPCVNPIFGPTQSSTYWSSSSYANDPRLAWLVPFYDAIANANFKSINCFVRAVRGGP
jgi:hypothetical protein